MIIMELKSLQDECKSKNLFITFSPWDDVLTQVQEAGPQMGLYSAPGDSTGHVCGSPEGVPSRLLLLVYVVPLDQIFVKQCNMNSIQVMKWQMFLTKFLLIKHQ